MTDKTLSIQVNLESLKKLKKMAIDNDISPSKQASQILEKVLNKKVNKLESQVE